MIMFAQKMEDRRLFERFPSRFPARIKDAREDFGTNIFLREASAEGVRIVAKEALYINDSVTLEVKLPDSSLPTLLKGRVVWVRKRDDNFWDVGLRFHEVNFVRMSRFYKVAAVV